MYRNAKNLETKHQPLATITLDSVWLTEEKRPGYLVKATAPQFGEEVFYAGTDKAEAQRIFAQY